CLMAQGAKQLYFLYNPIMKVLVMGFPFAHILIQGGNMLVSLIDFLGWLILISVIYVFIAEICEFFKVLIKTIYDLF
ncbi:hypothetical protein Q7Z20_08985, partial [Glaesserella parasuis]|nr:hypothetical protein [Glaesserella parasuis]